MSISTSTKVDTYPNIWPQMKRALMNTLYSSQVSHWNYEFALIVQRHALSLGVELDINEAYKAGIRYDEKTWKTLSADWMEPVPQIEYLVPTDFMLDDVRRDFERVIPELDKIIKERYEADRFISGLSLYNLRYDQLENILGDNLFGIVKVMARGLSREEEVYEPMPLAQFLQERAHVVEAMQERVIINLLMSDLIK